MRSAIVLGGGMVGVGTALHLQSRGWSVALVDRREPGRETSYGNAGIIQSEAVRPYAMPHDLGGILDIALARTNDVHYSLAALPYHMRPLLQYWWNSFPERHEVLTKTYAQLISRAAPEHEPLITAAGAGNLVRRDGFRVLHRNQAQFDKEAKDAEAVGKAFGVKFKLLSAAELAKAEPGLNESGIGGLHWQEPWTVSDPGSLVTSYAELFVRRGGKLLRGDATTLSQVGSGWAVVTDEGRIEAEAAVVSLGPWSPTFLKRFGYDIPMVRKRGYHRHYTGGAPLDLPLRDAAFGYLMNPMAKGVRITTGAELSEPDAELTPVQLGKAEAAARQLIDLGKPVEPEPWLGTRPCMPDMLPVVGETARHKGLWLHFGHGHQGFTLGPATGRILAELMSGEAPSVDVAACAPARFGA
ncbi:putative D-amino-acid dehydrogenase, DadA-like protein [Bradyrhizobium oligotrophicum S58]|uniref:Putative D-amino-acid dehydrogenase, DadA-like protein n=1 Tax=Bradyrhizobium oligotrophicum S58 TaxID=1245469 RepID=M4Z7C4_9BRAD|nr:FAD-binding oxidoreductase [Bradyrhizobium oligotrophicum]BAM89162.1 putative D-amino-acid dehydrogenase, DadA-like protein [Bradyrhizobium oligotrophicum S58]